MEIHPRVSQIDTLFGETRVALYFIRGERNAIIDTGTSQSPQNDIAPALKSLGLMLADIDLILNTHGHMDHTGGNTAIKSVSDAQIHLHTDDVVLMENHERYFEEYFGPAVEAIMGKEHLEEERANYLEAAGPNVAADRQLKDNDIIELGDTCQLRVIHLPGHSSGSAGFYWEEEGILFTGDALQGLGKDNGGLPIVEDLAAYEGALERLHQLPLKLMLHAHDFRGVKLPSSTMKRSDEIKQFVRDCQEFTKRMGEVVRQIAPNASGKPIMEVYDQVVEKLPKEMGFKPANQLPKQLFVAMIVYFALIQTSK